MEEDLCQFVQGSNEGSRIVCEMKRIVLWESETINGIAFTGLI